MYQKALLITSALLLAGCNTMQGLGEDMKSAGEGLAEGAQNIQKKITKDDSKKASTPAPAPVEQGSSTGSGYRNNPYSSY